MYQNDTLPEILRGLAERYRERALAAGDTAAADIAARALAATDASPDSEAVIALKRALRAADAKKAWRGRRPAPRPSGAHPWAFDE